MRQYKAGSSPSSKWIRAVVGGRVCSGKTHFATTFPKPIIIGDAAEGGMDTVEAMAKKPECRALWWDPNFVPDIVAIESMMELPQFITSLLNKKTHTNQTIVIDSLSIYAQRVMRELKTANPTGDGRQRYGELSDALSALVARVHSLPMHVVWLCHVDDEMQLTVPGKATASLWAYMGHKWMTYVDTSHKKTAFQLHTQPFQRAAWLGGRAGMEALPSPMVASFKPISELLGLPDRPISPSCPDFGGQSFMDGCSYLP
jgi:hypothetical protein